MCHFWVASFSFPFLFWLLGVGHDGWRTGEAILGHEVALGMEASTSEVLIDIEEEEGLGAETHPVSISSSSPSHSPPACLPRSPPLFLDS